MSSTTIVYLYSVKLAILCFSYTLYDCRLQVLVVDIARYVYFKVQ